MRNNGTTYLRCPSRPSFVFVSDLLRRWCATAFRCAGASLENGKPSFAHTEAGNERQARNWNGGGEAYR
jgi:hypothetical protein